MKRIKLTKGKYTLVDNSDYEFVSQWKWFALMDNKTFYAARTVRTGKTFKKILMHRLLTDAPKGMEVDHINGNKLDNRRKNLRLCTKTQNHHNRGLLKTNTSGYKGVSWSKRYLKWQSSIRCNNKYYFLGYFKNKKSAAKAYALAAKKLHKEFANYGRKK